MYLADSPLGPAGRWFIDRLKEKAALRVTLNSPESADLIEAVPIASRNLAQPRVVNGSSRDAAAHGLLVGARHNVR